MTETEYRDFVRTQRQEGLAAVRAMGDAVLAGWGLDPEAVRRQEKAYELRAAIAQLASTTAPLVRQVGQVFARIVEQLREHHLTVQDLVLAGPEGDR